MQNNLGGFSFIEILVALTIIGIISAVGMVFYQSAMKKARDARRKADLEQIRSALEIYKANDINNNYPTTSGWWGACSNFGSHADSGATGYVPNLAPQYMQKLPHDPKEGLTTIPYCGGPGASTGACYLYMSDGIDYKLLAHCTPEGTMSTTDPYFDPARPTWAWQVSSGPNSLGW